MTDPHKKKSSSSGPGQHHSELISMYDSHTWPETRRSETFHSQASKLWEFVTEEMVSGFSAWCKLDSADGEILGVVSHSR